MYMYTVIHVNCSCVILSNTLLSGNIPDIHILILLMLSIEALNINNWV